MFVEIEGLLADERSVNFAVSRCGKGLVRVAVMPSGPKGTDAALLEPFALVGTAIELDAEFAGLLLKHVRALKSLRDQAEATEAIVKHNTQKKAEQANKALRGKGASAAAAGDDDADDDEDKDDSGSTDTTTRDVETEVPQSPNSNQQDELLKLLIQD
jgi:PRTRC genetic system protein E